MLQGMVGFAIEKGGSKGTAFITLKVREAAAAKIKNGPPKEAVKIVRDGIFVKPRHLNQWRGVS